MRHACSLCEPDRPVTNLARLYTFLLPRYLATTGPKKDSLNHTQHVRHAMRVVSWLMLVGVSDTTVNCIDRWPTYHVRTYSAGARGPVA